MESHQAVLAEHRRATCPGHQQVLQWRRQLALKRFSFKTSPCDRVFVIDFVIRDDEVLVNFCLFVKDGIKAWKCNLGRSKDVERG
ncbi:hypothetical protein L596_016117 [Steinernema carpocapsae]|uniref:Uncharacterized protein n=1 Tax=Steinernema carpocapsae TaxID=34508 RepID=A0A4U5NI89_STECR|nr:hypothetical protein L596_016117 [Steinernema carpocapsae]